MNKDMKAISDLTWDYRAARVLQVANNLDIFTILASRRMSADQLSKYCHTKPQMTEKLLIAATAMGLLKKKGNVFSNTPLAEKYLVRGRKLYQGDIIAHSANVWGFWNNLENEILTRPVKKNKKSDEHSNFIMGMHNIAAAGRTKIFIDNIDLSGRRKLFDVGGGPGSYSIAACKKYPSLKAVVFDLPETISITKRIIAKEKLQGRISVKKGNWDTNDFGEDNDVVLLSNVLHGIGSNAELKLKKAYGSMQQNGLLVIQEFLLNDEKSGPLIPAIFNVMVGAYSKNELISLIRKAGFIAAKVAATSEDFGCTWITAKKA